MRRSLIILATLLSLLSPSAQAANSTVSAMTAASALGGTELLYIVQAAADRKATPAQIAAYVYGLASGDCTISGVGAIVCTKTNGTNFGALATTVPGTGVATFLTTPTSANLAAALTDETGTGAAVFAGSPALTGTPTAPTATVGTNTTQLATTAFVLANAGSGAVASVTGGIGVTVSPTTGAVVVSAAVTQRNNTGTTDTLLSADSGALVTESNASPVAVGIAVASTTGFTTGNYWTVKNKGAGLVTITPTTSTIDGSATLTIKQNQSVDFYSDGTNYWTMPGRPTNVACADLTNAGALCSTTPGTGVATAAANALSAAGGLTTTIGSTTLAMATSAIASGACTSAQPATVTNTATTDTVLVGFNGDPTAVTGFAPATTGMLTVIAYPAANTVNIKECNNTSASITPGAHTFNIRVVR